MSFLTLADFKAAISIDDAVSDVDLQRALDAANEWIIHYTGRTFSPVATSASVKLFLAYDNDVLDVPDVQSVTLLEVDWLADGTFSQQIDAQHYDLYPLNLMYGGYLQIRVKPTSQYFFVPGCQVRVTGMWGYGPSVPQSVIQAELLLANRYFHRPSAPFSLWEAPQTGELAALQAVDPDIVSLLGPYVTSEGAGKAASETWVLV